MEQLEIEHRGRIEKVRNATFKPNSRKYFKGSRVLTPERNVGDGKRLLESPNLMEAVSEESDSPKMSE